MAIDAAGDDADTETLATAIGMYALGEWSLGRAAEQAGISRFQFREVLSDLGLDVPIGGPEDREDAVAERDTLRDLE